MALAQWLIGFADGWHTLNEIPAACPEAGSVTDAVMFTSQVGALRVAVGTGGNPYFSSPHATFEFQNSDGWVSKSLYDPAIHVPWDGPDPLVVAAGQPLWIELDGASIDTEMIYFAVLIGSGSSAPSSLAGGVGSALQTSGARIVGFTG